MAHDTGETGLDIARTYRALVPADAAPQEHFARIAEEHARTTDVVPRIVEADALLDRHPVAQRTIHLRNPTAAFVPPTDNSSNRTGPIELTLGQPCESTLGLPVIIR